MDMDQIRESFICAASFCSVPAKSWPGAGLEGYKRSVSPLTTPSPIPNELLTTQAGGLRALARGLLVDEHGAEDVVQETWVTALERPPANREGWAGWLRAVARSLALKRRRGEGRRVAREARVERGEPFAGADEVLAQREILRQVTDAVLELAEPYQTAVLLRYYQDLSPREIASRCKVSVATVDSRLFRARELLRRRLDGTGGGRVAWINALCLLTGDPRPIAWTPNPWTPGGGLVMAGKVAVVLTVLVGSWTGVRAFSWQDPGAAEPVALQGFESQASEASAAGVALTSKGAGSAQDERASQRVAVPSERAQAEGPALFPAGEHAFVLHGVVVDEHDLPLQNVDVLAGPLAQPLNAVAETDAYGRFTLAFRADAAAVELALTLQDQRLADVGLYRFELAAGKEANVRFHTPRVGKDSSAVTKKQLAELERKLEATDDPKVRLKLDAVKKRTLVEFGTLVEHASLQRSEVAAERLEDGSIRFRWPSRDGIETLHTHRIRQLKKHEVVLQRVEQAEHAQLAGALHAKKSKEKKEIAFGLAESAPVPTAVVTGSVVDAQGRPTASPLLLLTGSGQRLLKSAPDGTFQIELFEPAGTVELLAGGGTLGRATTTFELAEHEGDVLWNATLDRGVELQGRTLGPDQTPLAKLVVECRLEGDGQVWFDGTHSDKTGTFALPNVLATGGRIFVRPAIFPPFAVATALVHGGATADIEVPAFVTNAVAVTVHAAAGEPVADAEVRLWQADSDRGAVFAATDQPGVYHLGGVPAGSYRLTVSSLGLGQRDLGNVWIDAQAPLDLGTVELPAPGTLRWNAEHGRSEAWVLLRDEASIASLVARGTLAKPFDEALPVGSYALWIEGSAEPVRFTLEAGAETVVELGRD